MSKEPEVGDVFKEPYSQRRFKIYDIVPLRNCTLVYYYQQTAYDTITKDVWELNLFMKRGYVYVGKSTTTIRDLFKTENEE